MGAAGNGEDTPIPDEIGPHQLLSIRKKLDTIRPDLILGSLSPTEAVIIDLLMTRLS